MVRPVQFKTILEWLQQKRDRVRIDKLGRNRKGGEVCHFFCTCPDKETILIFGDNDENGRPMKEREWELVCAFMRGLLVAGADTEKSGVYTNEKIPGTNRNYRSNVPALCRAYWDEKGGVR